jgi:hypothetical protein
MASQSRPGRFVGFFESTKKVVDGVNAAGVLVLLVGVLVGQQAFIHQFLGLKLEQSADLSDPTLLRTNETLDDFLNSAQFESMKTAQMESSYTGSERAERGRVYSVVVRIKGYPKETYDVYYSLRNRSDQVIERNRLFQFTTETTDDSFDVIQFWVPNDVETGSIVLRHQICERSSWFGSPDCGRRDPIGVKRLEKPK